MNWLVPLLAIVLLEGAPAKEDSCLGETRFGWAVREHHYAPRVDAHLVAGLNRGIRVSPVLIVNGRRTDGAPDLEKLIESAEAEMAIFASRETLKP